MHSPHIGSPGLGVTEPNLSVDPLATEGEATPGPDDYNPFDEAEMLAEERELDAADGAVEVAGFAPAFGPAPRLPPEF